jgi:hypothetical protein
MARGGRAAVDGWPLDGLRFDVWPLDADTSMGGGSMGGCTKVSGRVCGDSMGWLREG